MSYAAGAMLDAADFVHTSSTAPGAAAANFTDAGSYAAAWGPVKFLHIYVTTTNTITATNGNVSDVTMYTTGTSWRPPVSITCVAGNGLVTGEAILTTAGVLQLRAASDTVSAGSNLRMTLAWVAAPA